MAVLFQIALAVGSVVVLLGLMAVVKRSATAYGLSPEVQRKLVHIGSGCYALTLPWLFPERWPVYMLVGLTLVVMAVLRMPRFAKGGIGATLHAVERRSYGDLLLALAVGVVFLLADGSLILYVLPIAILTLSDAAAALTGSRYGTKFFTVEDGQKSVEGSVAFFMVTLIVAMVCLLLLSDVPRANVILLAVIVAGFGTLVEADSWRGFDNFFLPAGLMVFLDARMASDPVTLITIMLVFSAAIWAALRAAPLLGLTRHAARVYVIATFLLVSVTALHNTVLPLLVFVTHAISCRKRPCRAVYPELDCVAALALVSFWWLASEKIIGDNELPYYGLTAMGMSMGFVALIVASLPSALRWGSIACFWAVMVWLFHWLMDGNGAGSVWLTLGMAVIAALPPLMRPDRFHIARAGKVAVLAVVMPLVACLWEVGINRGWL
jgi:phytol kinase